MSVLPKAPVGAVEWAHQAWTQAKGVGITVPADALQALLDDYVASKRALEDDVRAILRERAESIETVEVPVG